MNVLKKHGHYGSQLFKRPDETRRLNGRSSMHGTKTHNVSHSRCKTAGDWLAKPDRCNDRAQSLV